ncbi:nuclear pore complex protein DDB_G0274915 [Anopheles ziemanni]|uniref:nuclear pore complex protein DDB_G0274915 n=1 Tax=Anopheles ziemanni TaxID=345580 RepID=UPI00265F2454|nr:nuclear pore complex protein DDB_G0274915 [Anopheles ziemanni]
MTDVEESIKVRLDQETANRLQNEHPEQFVTLVRMHLSFELDLNTDTENDPTGLDKQKIKKWKGFHKKAKGCTSVKAVSPEAAKTTLTKENIEDLKQLIAFLEMEENISQEGIFRKTGSVSRQNELKNLLVQSTPFSLDQGDYTAHDCASVLKSFLADLSEPLLTELYYPAYCQVADLFHSKDAQLVRREDRLLNALQLLLLLLPEENNTLLRCIIELLNRTIQYEATNKMSAENLATLFTPHLICPRKLGPEALHTTAQQMSGIVGFMIKTGLRLFHIPAKLATDIRAYFVEQKRRKTMSPEHILNESTTSDSVANTVYTFVDREKTAEAHIMNSTDTALAQLYAHIQSLPESSKKKKLVSKFNRQNGYGTPLQVLMLREKNAAGGSAGSVGTGSAGGMKYPRSIGDSIKRHIFHKSLMSRTPKRGAGSGSQTPVTFQTPNGANYSGPKQRVLFQSPISSSPSPSSGSPACLKRCSSVSSSSSSTLSLSSVGNGGTPQSQQKATGGVVPARTYSSGSSTSTSSSTTSDHQPERDQKRRSSGEPDERSSTKGCPTKDSESGASERKRSRVEKADEPSRPKSAPMVRFGGDIVACEMLEDGEPPPPEDDEDFVEQEDDDIGEEEDNVREDHRLHRIRHGCAGRAFNDEDDDDEDCERTLRLSDIEEDRYTISPGTGSSLGDTRSRYRSEPNLSAIVYQKHHRREQATNHRLHAERTVDGAKPKTQPASGPTKARMNINFFKNKLIKGVSMGNLRFPFGNDSKASKKNTKPSIGTLIDYPTSSRSPSLPSTVTSTVQLYAESPADRQRGWNGKIDQLEPTTVGGLGGSWASTYLSSTPGPANALGGRNSMSPITKSTQRMPKSMQESIMTPRSRKPVVLLGGMNGNDQQQLSTTCASFSSLREEDEEVDLEPIAGSSSGTISTASSSSSLSSHVDPNLKMLLNDTGLPRIADEVGLPPVIPLHSTGNMADGCGNGVGMGGGSTKHGDHESSSLTSTFRDYLLSRSVMPESPADLSFASQSDDFESSSERLEQLSESKMSESLLYCMNGNDPPKDDVTEATADKGARKTVAVFPGCDSELDETAL